MSTANINDEYVIIFRYKTHGFRFELLCRRRETEQLLGESGGHFAASTVDDERVLARILFKPTVYANAKRKEIATKSSLVTAFGAATTVREMIVQILTKGEVLETQRDREINRNSAESMKQEIISYLPSMLLNTFSGVNPDISEVNDAISSVLGRWKPSVFGVPLVVEAGYVASRISHKIDCVRVLKKVVLTYNKTLSTRQQIGIWHDFLIGYAPVVCSIDSFEFSMPQNENEPSSPPPQQQTGQAHSTSTFVRETLIIDAIVLTRDATWKRLSTSFATSVEETKISESEIRQFSEILFDPPSVVCVGWEAEDCTSTALDSTAQSGQIRDLVDREKVDDLAKMVLNRHIGDEDVGDYREAKGKRSSAVKTSSRSTKNAGGGNDNDSQASSSDEGKGKKRRGNGSSSASASSRITQLEIELQSKTHKALQELCKKNGMSSGGKKDDLVDRLVAFELNK